MLLKLTNISKRYEAPGAGSLLILDDVTLELDAGESLAIVGPSGSGKSTLMHIIGTLDTPTGGQIEFAGRNLLSLDNTQLAQVRNQEIGFVFQAHYLLPQCTVFENVLVPTLAHPKATRNGDGSGTPSIVGGETAESRATRLLKRVGLGHRLDHRPGQLSGGERQRVAVVRALINGPRLLLADEPTGSLDRTSADELGQLLLELNAEEQVALVVVTHAPELARRMARVFELKAGHLEPMPT